MCCFSGRIGDGIWPLSIAQLVKLSSILTEKNCEKQSGIPKFSFVDSTIYPTPYKIRMEICTIFSGPHKAGDKGSVRKKHPPIELAMSTSLYLAALIAIYDQKSGNSAI
jgi:hypothetical protein